MNTLYDNFNKILKVLALITVAAFIAAGCQSSTEETQKTADLVYVNWAEGIAYTHLAENVLEEKMGYDVNLTSADVGPAYTAIANGDQDAFMETWLPVLHQNYIERFEEDIVDLGHVYEGTQSGLVVPTYVEVDSISNLNQYTERFDGQITGIDAGAGVMQTTQEVIDEYNLDYELITSSGPAMTAALSSAIENEEPIIVTGWQPHWKFGRWDLKFLKQDEDNMLWERGNIHIMGRQNLEQDKPELAQFLKNMFFTEEQLGDLMVAVEQSDQDVSQVTMEWMNEHEELINSWIPEGAGEMASME
ncbi:glycine betaine ABC transporter substrate-binding protein [Rhodohalobacter sp. 8-1]|uniref:glycine betaine ABC transporter substrate-binding protein n=1 Tax=Rhodohalobacter sp. 8-1 TaxID=3131972 RepID=UPI0030EC06F9